MKQEHRVMVLSISAAVGFWFFDALGDYFFKSSRGPFLRTLLFDTPTHEFFIRPMVATIFIFFGLAISTYIRKVRDFDTRYRQLFDSIDDGIFLEIYKSPDRLEKFAEVNEVACKKLGYSREELLQLSPLEVSAPEERPNLPGIMERLHHEQQALFETILLKKDGARLPVEIHAHLTKLAGEPAILAMMRDLTARKESEAEIRRLATFPQMNPNPVLEVTWDGEITFLNEAARETLKKLGLQDARAFLPPDLPEIIKTAAHQGTTQFQRELAIDSLVFSGFIHIIPAMQASRLYLLDITARQRGEEALQESERQLRLLTSQLLNVQEAERRRISIELHDELGQALLFLKLQLGLAHDRLRKDQQGLRNDCGYLLRYLDGVIENVRRLSRDLSPSVLEELGLSSAIKYLLEEFGKLYGVKESAVALDNIDQLFPPRVQLNIYRIFQECLTNIGKHAQATQVSLAVKRDEGQVSFLVQDNGRGFDPQQVKAREAGSRGIGMATIAERVRLIDGSLHIQSQAEGGTKITFTVPVELGGN